MARPAADNAIQAAADNAIQAIDPPQNPLQKTRMAKSATPHRSFERIAALTPEVGVVDLHAPVELARVLALTHDSMILCFC
jgi:hypothetical protein